MARDHARLFVSILSDDDWRARGPMAQWLYGVLLAQPDLTYAGATDLRLGRWASSSAGVTVAMVDEALAELEAHRFVVVDRDTEEVLVRSYLRRNEVWKQPKLLTLALRQATTIQSRRLRSALRSELLRLPSDDRTGPAVAFAASLPDTPWYTPADTPPDTPPDRPNGRAAGTHAPGVRAHAGASQPGTSNQEPGTSLPPEKSLGGSVTSVDARDDTNAPPNSNPKSTNGAHHSQKPRCLAHRQLADDDPGPPCVGCREARQAADRAAMAAQHAAQQAIRACPRCDAEGRRLDLLGQHATATRCDHKPYRPEPQPDGAAEFQQVRDQAQRVPCPELRCRTPDDQPTPAGEPCHGPDGEPLRAPAHAARIAAARKVPA